MKYEKEIKRIFSDFHENWMSEQERAEFDATMMSKYGETISKALQDGVNKGYPLEYQMAIVHRVLKKELGK
mgnify:CR=1 FL=1